MTARFSQSDFAELMASSNRLVWLFHDLSIEQGVGLEIGALDNPTAMPVGVKVEYVDYAETNVLQSIHEDRQNIVSVSHVWAGSGSLADVCEKTDYDFVIASHVIEHVPNVLGWFEGIFEVLRPGGVFNLAIPDRRFTFDIRRKPSTLGEMVEAYLLKYTQPSVRQIFDHTFDSRAVNPGEPWETSFNLTTVPRYCGDDAMQFAFEQSKRSIGENKYFDAHCWVFTPLSFLDLIYGATELGIFPFIINDFSSTKQGDIEFHVSFAKEIEPNGDKFKNDQLAAIKYVKSRVEAEHKVALLLSET